MHQIYTTEIPLGHIHFNEFFDLVVSRDVRPERPEDDEAPGLTDAVWELAEACWIKDPKRRPTASAASEMVAQIIKQNTLSSFGGLAMRPPNPPPPTPVDSDGDRTARQLPPMSPPSVLGGRPGPGPPLSQERQVVPRDSNRTPPARPPGPPPPIRQLPVTPLLPPPPPPYTAVGARYEPVQPLTPIPRVAPRELARTPRPSSPASRGFTPDRKSHSPVISTLN